MGNVKTRPLPGALPRGAWRESEARGAAEGARPAAGFCRPAQEPVALGAEAIITNGGFVSLFQWEIAAALGVPVTNSSLLQAPWA